MAKNLEDDYRMQKIIFCIIHVDGNRQDKQAGDQLLIPKTEKGNLFTSIWQQSYWAISF
jgi:hypothetical protein